MDDEEYDDSPPSKRFETLWNRDRNSRHVIDFALKSILYQEVRDISAGAYLAWLGLIELEKLLLSAIEKPEDGSSWDTAKAKFKKWNSRFFGKLSTIVFRWSDQKDGNALIEVANADSDVEPSITCPTDGSDPIASTTAIRLVCGLSNDIVAVFKIRILPMLNSNATKDQTASVENCKLCLAAFQDWTGKRLESLGSFVKREERKTVSFLVQNEWLIKQVKPLPGSPEDLVTINQIAKTVKMKRSAMTPHSNKWGKHFAKKGNEKLYSYQMIRPLLMKQFQNLSWPEYWNDGKQSDF